MKQRALENARYATVAALLLFASLTIAAPCNAQAQFPETPAGTQAKAWLDAFNAGDADKYKEFLRKNFPARLQNADQEARFREMTGGFELKKVEESTPTKMVALVQERRSDQFARLSVEVEAAEPHQITKVDLNAIQRPPDFALKPLSESELIAALRKRLDEESAAGRFSGTALLRKNGKTVFAQAYG